MKIISGGQTGVDRAALDAALDEGVFCGGWCPKGRRAEDGIISSKYPLKETPLTNYSQRTEWNIKDSDGTLIFFKDKLKGGTALTEKLSRKLKRPFLLVDINQVCDVNLIVKWIVENRINVLNIAGPREDKNFGIHKKTKRIIKLIINKYAKLSDT